MKIEIETETEKEMNLRFFLIFPDTCYLMKKSVIFLPPPAGIMIHDALVLISKKILFVLQFNYQCNMWHKDLNRTVHSYK